MATPPFNLDAANPVDNAAQNVFPANERTFRDNVASYLNMEHDINSGHHRFPALSTSSRDAITDWPNGAVIYNTSLGTVQINTGPDGGPANWLSAGPNAIKTNYMSTSVSTTYTIQATNMVFFIVGGGGGGGGGTVHATTPGGGGGGGSGGFQIYPIYGMTVGNNLIMTVGSGGAGGVVGAAGAAGTDTVLASGTETITSCTAGGGGGGVSSAGPNAGGTGGTVSGGIVGQSVPLPGHVGGNGYTTPTVGLPGLGGHANTGLGNFGIGGLGGYSDTSVAIAGEDGGDGFIMGVYYSY